MKKVIMIGIALLGISAAAYLAYWFYPREVNLEAQGIQYRLGHPSAENTRPLRVSIQGKIYRSLNGDRTFTGTVDLEGVDIPVPKNQRVMDFKSFQGSKAFHLAYAYNHNGKPYIYMMGMLYPNDDFSAAVITLVEYKEDGGSWSGSDGLMVAAPAANREEAVALSNELMRDDLNGLVLE